MAFIAYLIFSSPLLNKNVKNMRRKTFKDCLNLEGKIERRKRKCVWKVRGRG